MTTVKTLTVEDFGLSEKELAELVTGAQKFLPPAPDESDVDRLPVPSTS